MKENIILFFDPDPARIVDQKRISPLYEAAQSAGMPILFHAGLNAMELPGIRA